MPPSTPIGDIPLLDFTETKALWSPEPKSRGTFSILSLCLSTIFICVWKAWHPNIPPHSPEKRSKLKSMGKSILWFLLFLFLPEGLFVMAFEDLRKAYILYYNINHLEFFPPVWYSVLFQNLFIRRSRQAKNPRPYTRQNHWTLTHSFYAVMGGYAEPPKEPNGEPCVLRSGELQKIIQDDPDRVPELSEQSILARSQQDSLSKVIALIQIFSFCMTCILRRISELPLSVLEITTIGYAVCAILAYILWWKKPHIMTEPTLLKMERETITADPESSGRQAPMVSARTSEEGMGDGTRVEILTSSNTVNDEENNGEPGDLADKEFEPEVDQYDDDTDGRLPSVSNIIYPTQTQGRRGQKMLRKDMGSVIVWTIGSISPAVYGLLHLLAWNGSFPTPVERTLWRISTVVVITSGMAIALGLLVLASVMLLISEWSGDSDWKETTFETLGYVFTCSIVLLYILARAYMIVETFRQLLFLPPESFQVASWSKYLPQIS
ncbi:hypothetical protein QCA50_014828 [Cerrena zonata]|uniref:Transmembrane protein n=1 Tax=Cerrena zonata TaxID=2478898 RepID=A0AAW0FN20_9APHY